MSTLITNIAQIGTIKDAGGNATALTIDSAGRILQPTKPAFAVFQNANLSNRDYTTPTKAPFDTKDFDIGNNVTINNSAVFAAPINGIYHFGCNIMLDAIDTSGYVDLMLYIDDLNVGSASDLSYRHLEDVQGGSYATMNVSALIQLTENQTVTPYVRVNTDTAVGLRDGARFFGYLVS